MTKEDLLKKYHKLFGADAPEPPAHLLPLIIQLEESGEMERLSTKQRGKFIKLLEKLDELGDTSLDKDNPLWSPIETDPK